MKQFLISLAIFSAIFFVVDKCFIVVRNMSAGLEADKRLEDIVTGKINADVLVFGSSRGARNVIAGQISDAIGKKVYNLSYPGSNIEFHDYLLEQVLQYDRKPHTVVLVVDGASELLDDATIKFRFDRLFPLVKYEPIRNTLVEKDMKNKVLMNLFVLHQLNLNNFLLYQKKFTELDTVFGDGSMPVSFQSKKFTGEYDSTIKPYKVSAEQPVKLRAFLSFIDRCNKNNIRLILAFPPNYFPIPREANARLQSLAAGKSSFMMYDTTKKEYKDPSFYYDYSHLKRDGAVIFTNELSEYLKRN